MSFDPLHLKDNIKDIVEAVVDDVRDHVVITIDVPQIVIPPFKVHVTLDKK